MSAVWDLAPARKRPDSNLPPAISCGIMSSCRNAVAGAARRYKRTAAVGTTPGGRIGVLYLRSAGVLPALLALLYGWF